MRISETASFGFANKEVQIVAKYQKPHLLGSQKEREQSLQNLKNRIFSVAKEIGTNRCKIQKLYLLVYQDWCAHTLSHLTYSHIRKLSIATYQPAGSVVRSELCLFCIFMEQTLSQIA